jgi:hypothetical protein
MPLDTKITLSNKELSLIGNTEWILLKQEINKKICLLFADCSSYIKTQIIPFYDFPASALNKPPKISKGENYRMLPYIVLDYPAHFDRKDIFALRTLFWWGNFVSINLHVAGDFISCVDFSVIEKQSDKDFPLYVSIAETQWEHCFGEDNYVLCKNLDKEEIQKIIKQKRFLKIALKFDLADFEKMSQNLEKGYKQIARLLISYPNDKKGL